MAERNPGDPTARSHIHKPAPRPYHTTCIKVLLLPFKNTKTPTKKLPRTQASASRTALVHLSCALRTPGHILAHSFSPLSVPSPSMYCLCAASSPPHSLSRGHSHTTRLHFVLRGMLRRAHRCEPHSSAALRGFLRLDTTTKTEMKVNYTTGCAHWSARE